MTVRSNNTVFVDAHVHIHECFDVERVLYAAAKNFSKLVSGAYSGAKPEFILCLTETSCANRFSELAEVADSRADSEQQNSSGWNFGRKGEECITAAHASCGEITIVAGRQIVTAERLEILALGTAKEWEDGLPIVDVVNSVIDANAIPVLPWGFGKWLGSRKVVVHNLIDKFSGTSLYLGDNSGRPRFMSEPTEFALAEKQGIGVLPGSDPLPFRTEFDRAGSFGFSVDIIDKSVDTWQSVKSTLKQDRPRLRSFGTLESPLRFVRNQVAMQYVTRFSRSRRAS